MVHLVKKVKKGNTYLYLAERGRVEGKSKQIWQIYLGPEERFKKGTKLVVDAKIETKTVQFGLLAALLHVTRKLDLVSIIDQATGKRDQGLGVGDHVLIAAINRCVAPCSKTQLREWLDSTILRGIYPGLDVNIDAGAYWNHFKYLDETVVSTIEEHLAKSVREQFGVNFNNLSFDPTNFFTYINPRRENQTIPEHGHSKEGRTTLNLVNVSLLTTLDRGIPLFHLVYPGNKQDAGHFREMALPALKTFLAKLEMKAPTVTLVFDKGNLSQDAFDMIDEAGYKYICSDRPSSHKEDLAINPDDFKLRALPNGKKVGCKELRLERYGRERRFIAVFSPREAEWKQGTLESKVAKKVEEIEGFFKDRFPFAPGEKRRGTGDKWRNRVAVEEKVEAMLGKKYKNIIDVGITGPKVLPVDKGGQFEIKVTVQDEAMAKKRKTLGKSFLMTNREDLEPLDVVWAYRQQYLTERAFKWLKNPDFLSLRPMFHRVDTSIHGHVFVCFMGLLLLSLLVHELLSLGVKTTIFKTLTHLKAITLTCITLPGRESPVLKIDTLSPPSKELFDALDLGRFL